MNEKVVKKIKLVVTVVIAVLFVWFLIISPFLTFKHGEKTMEDAAKRYFELNSSELPTGNRIKTVSLQTLYTKSFIKEDIYIPYTKEACSVTNSWVKVKKENNEYKYYTYLECGIISSSQDAKGPEILLNGEDEITINKGEKFKDPGVKSVIDNKDGKLDASKVTVSGEVNTKKTGTYTITYTAYDSLRNQSTKERKVTVVSRLKNIVEEETDKTGYYTGYNPNNYLSLSGMLFRIVSSEGKNVKIVAEEDIANVNYDGIDEWLDYYYEHLNGNAKKLIVKSKYCNASLTDTTLDTTECAKYTKERNAYILSIDEINRAQTIEGNFLKPVTMSWTANKKDKEQAYITRKYFVTTDKSYITQNQNFNYGVRPVLTIKGDSLVKSGNGTKEKPYSLGETKKASGGDLLNTRYSGEYVQYSGMLFRIVDINNDGTTKVIATETIKNGDGNRVDFYYSPDLKNMIYNPTQEGNAGYYIKNKTSEYLDTTYFVNHQIEVPIYKNRIKYGKEIQVKKYKAKVSAPNMYEMFSAYTDVSDHGLEAHWLINSSQNENYAGAMTDIGVIVNEKINDYDRYGIRPVGFLDKSIVITSGNGTVSSPYKISK